MEKKTHTYQTDTIKVTYDSKRCIHAAECVKGLRKVFDPKQRPWIQPEQAESDKVAEIVTRCPTGALHYQAKKDGPEDEQPPPKNTISVTADGPVYFRGKIEVQDHEGNTLLRDTRFALCRCGKSANKPACDNSHANSGFEAHSHISKNTLSDDNPDTDHDKLLLKAMKNGPVLVEGQYEIYSNTTQPMTTSKTIALCRCGGSDNKPFCDGTHKEIEFRSQ